ncbi:SDR family oxidoreductase [Leptolyngbya sp. 15MV]|nr:SDR family oxidoreductase [Leptolyngbya sp. 15MV]
MDGPVAIVTGAGSGIGRACAIALARHGYRLVLVGRRRGPLDETAGLLPRGSQAVCVAADVADRAATGTILSATEARFGALHVLVNNAGLAPMTAIDRHTPELLDEIYQVNALGPARLIAAAWAWFVRQRERDPSWRGCVVNVSSIATVDPLPGFFGYAAAKAAVNLMAQSCASEGASIGVRAFSVAPGAVETAMLRSILPESVVPRSRTLAPEDVAQVVVSCVAGERDAENGRTIVLPNP